MALAKNIHEIRDPIHIFIHLDSDERKVLDSRPFQRLRYIHQLGLSYLVYPSATHKRFEHSLGVMELASRVFDIITHKDAVNDEIRKLLPEISNDSKLDYWRRVLRMAALCHDLGHIPFSHSAEKKLLPEGWSHEKITREIILSDEMQDIWKSIKIFPEDIVKISIGQKEADDLQFTDWETILAEIIVGDSFGVDRMDYLLRDSYHAGVAYGKFDHYRLIDTLRILVVPDSTEPALGVEEGGIQSAEALLLARYFIYSQVYCHQIRRIYDIHLMDFLKEWLPNHEFPISVDEHLKMTDNNVIVALLEAAFDKTKSGHDSARRIICREHFKPLYKRHPDDIKQNMEAGLAIYEAARKEFGDENVRHDKYVQKGSVRDFPVRLNEGDTVSSLFISDILKNLPILSVEYIFINPDIKQAKQWLDGNRIRIIQQKGDEK
jgi:HD superfamily phosphohydrolase